MNSEKPGVDRRGFLKRAGLVSAAAAGAPLAAAAPAEALDLNLDLDLGIDLSWLFGRDRYQWLVGDHHIHTQYSYDAMYTVDGIADGARRHGADWAVITDHGHASHEKSSVERTNAAIRAAQREHRDLLLWQGMEWNVPGAEHATLFFQAGADQAAKLREFERAFDWRLTGTEPGTPDNEALAVKAIRWLAAEERARRIHAPVVVINHPLRNGRVAPHEIRALRDAAPGIVIGMEGAPGAQADGFPKPLGSGGGARGGYGNSPGSNSWPGFPASAYRTYGGFDWSTATVGGLWDSLLAEGKPWWITSNSDSHYNRGDTLVRPGVPDGYYDEHGSYPDPIDTGVPQTLPPYADFAPAEFSRTVVGVTRRSHEGVLEGLRAGRVWVVHGGLAQELEFGAYSGWSSATMGGRLRVRRGDDVTIVVSAKLAARPNGGGSIPRLARLDLVSGPVTGPAADRDAQTAPGTRVVRSFEPRWAPGRRVAFRHTFRNVREPFFVRTRGTDGRKHVPGGIEPSADVIGQSNPFEDLWLYGNPIFVDVR
ncbi:PHP domain-containing protein [Amycolatopsis oliviviridis]|uniref:PHP domain-containing protein n=1 Tax=Amycolatopsis oliviviridis TaxID=1471590 RepID=UPI00174D507A|nr:PHP domain-containing protein [Amycolatopsis oliviviridis]